MEPTHDPDPDDAESVHVAPLVQGLLVHSVMSAAQLAPNQPRLHEQLYVFNVLVVQVAPFRHGLLMHSSTSTLQL